MTTAYDYVLIFYSIVRNSILSVIVNKILSGTL